MPYVIEPAAGATRTMMAFLLSAYDEDEVGGEVRTVLRLHWRLAPYQVAVLPLSKKEPLEPFARQVLARLQPHFMCDYDTTQGIGKRYRRQDEVGTPWCVTVDFDSLEDDAVTVRDRDTHRAGAGADRRAGRPSSAGAPARSSAEASVLRRRLAVLAHAERHQHDEQPEDPDQRVPDRTGAEW